MVQFVFKINRSFVGYRHHPITIPKAQYGQLEGEQLLEDSISINSPFGNMAGRVAYGVAGFGPYYQITMNGRHTGDAMSGFRFGQRIAVEMKRLGNSIQVNLSQLNN